jgi:hypothetical protein
LTTASKEEAGNGMIGRRHRQIPSREPVDAGCTGLPLLGRSPTPSSIVGAGSGL